jgi:hypothetical protein
MHRERIRRYDVEGVFELLNPDDTEFRIDGLVEIRQQSVREEAEEDDLSQ